VKKRSEGLVYPFRADKNCIAFNSIKNPTANKVLNKISKKGKQTASSKMILRTKGCERRSKQREVMTKAAISWLLFAGYLHNHPNQLLQCKDVGPEIHCSHLTTLSVIN